EQHKVVVLLIMMVIAAALEVAGVGLMVPLMTAIVDPGCISTNSVIAMFCGITGITGYQTFVLICVLALIVIYVVKDSYIIWETKVLNRFIYGLRYGAQCKIYDAYMRRSYEFYLGASSGEVYRVVTNDVTQTYSLLTAMLNLVSESIVAVAMIVTVFVINPLMTILVAVAMGITSGLILIFIRPQMKNAGNTNRKYSALFNTWMNQSITGIKEIKVSNTEEFFKDTFNNYGARLVEAQRKNEVWSLIPRLIIEMVAVCSALGIVAGLIVSGYSMQTLVPAMSAFAMAAVKLLPSANRIVTAMNTISYTEPALDRLVSEMAELDEKIAQAGDSVVTRTNTADSDSHIRPKNAVSLSGITYAYPNAPTNVLTDADMEIPVGQSVGIVGASGAGKTTAVDILLGLLTPQKGQVLSDGVDIQSDYSGWLKCLAYIPQMIFLTDDTIRANVAFGIDPAKVDDEQVWRALEQAQLADFVRTLPDGLDNRIGERGVRLSGGQRQRIGVARALYLDPEILVFDEATSALDNDTEAAIMESINALHGSKTLIIIAHRLTTIEGCDMVYRVGDGKIVRER
ncbi:MAG: ABC transporter ATP-binding protein, partial [Pseudobutyrivibrio sp.]|nr:ABC transporter ATP-binding protein [Pseudobutyrivibrio sp.]